MNYYNEIKNKLIDNEVYKHNVMKIEQSMVMAFRNLYKRVRQRILFYIKRADTVCPFDLESLRRNSKI